MKCDKCDSDTHIINIVKLCERCHKMGDITKNFSKHEFACGCGCGYDTVDEVFVERLQRIRDKVGFSMPINSGCRCEQHNSDEGGSDESDHLTGEGADIGVASSRDRFDIIEAAILEGIKRIGPGESFVHLGVAEHNPQRVLWVY